MDALFDQLQDRMSDLDNTPQSIWTRETLLNALRWADTCRSVEEFENFAYAAWQAAERESVRIVAFHTAGRAIGWHSAWCAARRAQGKGVIL